MAAATKNKRNREIEVRVKKEEVKRDEIKKKENFRGVPE